MPTLSIKQAVEHLISRKKARFFVDTCFILHPKAFELLEKDIITFLQSWKHDVVLPYPVIFELEKHSKEGDDLDLTKRARKSIKALNQHKSEGAVRILGNPGEKFADQVFLEVFTKFRPKYDLLLFTQDRGLCRDLLRLNRIESTSRCVNEIWVSWHNGKELVASRNIRDMPPSRINDRGSERPIQDKATRSAKIDRSSLIFQKFSVPRTLDNSIVGSRETPQPGDLLQTQGGKRLLLGKRITAGGEGEIYEFDGGKVAKIYFPDRRTAWRSEKLEMMCKHQIEVPHVCWPIDRLLSGSGDFLGYVMAQAKGKTLQHSVFSKDRIEANFPRWNRMNLINLAITIASQVRDLNALGIIVGDLNPMNFLVHSDTEVHLVDVDSVQICDFPCPVGMVTFRAPEITEPSFEKFLRTGNHEAFALASLLFMILMGGKPPFSFQGGGDPADNIRKGNFPYVTDRKSIPPGAYRYIWSHFPNIVCDGFERAFVGKNPARRPSPGEWVSILEKYASLIGHSEHPESRLIWPNSFRPFEGQKHVQLKCEECHTNFQTSPTDAKNRKKRPKILCGSCTSILNLARKAGENHTCNKCKKHFQVSFDQVQRHGTVLEMCDECVGAIANTTRSCKQCGSGYTIDLGEARFLLAKGLTMPKRCNSCRGKSNPVARQPQGRQPQARRTQQYTPPPKPDPGSSLWDAFKSFFG